MRFSLRRAFQIAFAFCLLTAGAYVSVLAGQVTSAQTASELMQQLRASLESANNQLSGYDTANIAAGAASAAGKRVLAGAAFDELCREYPLFEARFGTPAQEVAGWQEMQKLAVQVYATLENTPPVGYQRNDPNQKAWMLIFEGKYDEALEHIAKTPSMVGKDLTIEAPGMKAERDMVLKARISAYAAKGDYAGAAKAAVAGLTPDVDDGVVYLLTARVMAKAGNADAAREYCQIVSDIFPGNRNQLGAAASETAKQYNFSLRTPDMEYIIQNYINSKKSAWLTTGIAALGAHHFPGAFERLESYYKEKGTYIKESALRGMANLADEKSIAFLLKTSLTEPEPVSRGFGRTPDMMPPYAFSMLCATSNGKAVLEYMKLAQNDARLRVNIDISGADLGKLFGASPEPEDPARPNNIQADQWIRWLQKTGRLEPLTPQSTAPLGEAYGRRLADVWLFMQLAQLERDTKLLAEIGPLCDGMLRVFDRTENLPPENKPETISLVLLYAMNGSFESSVPARIRLLANRFGRAELSVPAWFSADEKAFYKDELSQIKIFIKGLSECADLLNNAAEKRTSISEVRLKIGQIRTKGGELVALRQSIFSKPDNNRRLKIILRDGSEVLRSTGLEKYPRNMQKMSGLLSTLGAMCNPQYRGTQEYINKTYARAQAMAARQASEGAMIKNKIIADEYAAYYKFCMQSLNEMAPLLKDRSTVKSSPDLTAKYLAQSQESEERMQWFARLAVAATLQEQGAAVIYPVSDNTYDYVKITKTRTELIQKEIERYSQAMSRGTYANAKTKEFFRSTDTAVEKNESEKFYYEWLAELSSYLKAPEAVHASVASILMSGDDAKKLENFRAQLEPLKIEYTKQIEVMRGILKTQSFKNDKGAAYAECREKLIALSVEASRLFTAEAGIVQIQERRALKYLNELSEMNIPELKPMSRSNFAMGSLFLNDDSGKVAGISRYGGDYSAEDYQIWIGNVGKSLAELKTALEDSRAINTEKWDAPLCASLANWQSVLSDIITDMEKMMQIPYSQGTHLIFLNDTIMRAYAESLRNEAMAFGSLLSLPALVPFEGVDDEE